MSELVENPCSSKSGEANLMPEKVCFERKNLYVNLKCNKVTNKVQRLKKYYDEWVSLWNNYPESNFKLKTGLIESSRNKSFIMLDLEKFREIPFERFIEAMKFNVIFIGVEKLFMRRVFFCAHVASAIRFQLVNVMMLEQPIAVSDFSKTPKVNFIYFFVFFCHEFEIEFQIFANLSKFFFKSY